MSFTSPIDIANRALQHCGAQRITAFTDDSRNAAETAFAYDKLREQELRRNNWRFAIRKAVLRPVSLDSLTLAPAAWASGTTYGRGALVTSDSRVWQSRAAGNLANTPGDTSSAWELYFGPTTYEPYDKTVTYYAGDVAFVPQIWASGTTYAANAVVTYSGLPYLALQGSNTNHNPASATTYWQVLAWPVQSPTYTVTSPVVYLSLVSNNSSVPGADTNWLALSGTTTAFQPLYPMEAGPSNDSASRNVFVLPQGFLREAPQSPKAGSVSFLGAPTGRMYKDWEFENNYLISRDPDPIIFRFSADVVNVPLMDPMFCEGLACAIGEAVCETLTQSMEKVKVIAAEYRRVMSEARMVNGIEEGPTEPPEDDWITCRI